jgi:hypothetical protein
MANGTSSFGPIIDTRMIIILLTIALSLTILCILVIWPFVGTLVRFWAHYTPSHVVLGEVEHEEQEQEQEQETGQIGLSDDSPRSRGYWSLFRHIIRIQVSPNLVTFFTTN